MSCSYVACSMTFLPKVKIKQPLWEISSLSCYQLPSIGGQLPNLCHLQIHMVKPPSGNLLWALHRHPELKASALHPTPHPTPPSNSPQRQPSHSSSNLSQMPVDHSSRTQSLRLAGCALEQTPLCVSSSQLSSPLLSSALFYYYNNFLTGFPASTPILTHPPFTGIPKWPF